MSLLRTCLLAVLASVLFCLDTCEVPTGFDIGEMVGDPSGTSVYLIDTTTPKLYAIDTGAGTVRVQASLQDGSGDPLPAEAVVGAYLALSTDGLHLYISLPREQCIQRYATADLAFEAETPLAFVPDSFVVTADGIICVAHEGTTRQTISSVDPSTGTVLASDGNLYWPLLRLGEGGTRVYAMERGISIGSIASWQVGNDGTLVAGSAYTASTSNGSDLAVSETANVLYPMGGGVYGLGIVGMNDGSVSFASFGGSPYGNSVALSPGSTYLAAASTSDISLYRRSDHGRLATYRPYITTNLPQRCLAMTANGHVIYRTDTNRLGIIGRSQLAIDANAPIARITTTPGNLQLSLSATTSNGGGSDISSYLWMIDGAGVANDESIVWTFAASGTHDIGLVITNADGQSTMTSTTVVVTEASPPTYRLAIIHGTGSGTYAPGSLVDITATPPKQNLVFAGWEGAIVADAASATTSLVMPAMDVSVTATFAGSPSDPRSACETSLTFDVGGLVGDPTGHTVYVIDASTPRLLAIDSRTGVIRGQTTPSDMSATPYLASSLEDSDLALSPDGQHLYLLLPTPMRVQKYATSDLTLLAETQLHTYTTSVVATATGHLCIVGPGFSGASICTVDPSSGGVIASADSLYHPLLRLGESGNRIYAMERGLSGHEGEIQTWDVGSDGSLTVGPVFIGPQSNGIDLSVSEQDRQIYPMHGGVYGLTVIDMDADTSRFFGFDSPYGVAAAQVPGATLVAAASPLAVSLFERPSFRRLAVHPPNAGLITDRGLAMSSNGVVVYKTDARRLGIIGVDALSIDPAAPIACFTARSTGGRGMRFASTASSGGATAISGLAWSIDGVQVSSDATFETEFATHGRHTVELVVTNASGLVSMSRRSVAIPAPSTADDDQDAAGSGPNCGAGAASGLMLAMLLFAWGRGARGKRQG